MGISKLQRLAYLKVKFLLAALTISLAYCCAVCAAEIIVNHTVPAGSHSLMDVRAIFTMQQRFWPNGEQIKVFTLSDGDPVHKDFVKNNLNMFPHQLRRGWDRMTFSGTGNAPIRLESEQDMIDKLINTPYSIGYLNSRPDNEKIRLFEYQ